MPLIPATGTRISIYFPKRHYLWAGNTATLQTASNKQVKLNIFLVFFFLTCIYHFYHICIYLWFEVVSLCTSSRCVWLWTRITILVNWPSGLNYLHFIFCRCLCQIYISNGIMLRDYGVLKSNPHWPSSDCHYLHKRCRSVVKGSNLTVYVYAL